MQMCITEEKIPCHTFGFGIIKPSTSRKKEYLHSALSIFTNITHTRSGSSQEQQGYLGRCSYALFYENLKINMTLKWDRIQI
jgi:hypothetical protein